MRLLRDIESLSKTERLFFMPSLNGFNQWRFWLQKRANLLWQVEAWLPCSGPIAF